MPPTTIDEYLGGLPDDERDALGRLRALIHAAAPDAIETIAYGRPGFRLDGRYFVGFSASKAYCSFYAGRAPLLALADELKGYRTWKGTINFRADQPLPADLVARLIQARLAEYRAG